MSFLIPQPHLTDVKTPAQLRLHSILTNINVDIFHAIVQSGKSSW